eukprot:g15222.t1
MADFKKAHAIAKAKEMWVLGREYLDTPDKPRVEPPHLFTTLGCQVNAVGNAPLINRQQRDDAISKYMSAQNALTKGDAVQCVGECLIDTQILSIETPATTFGQRWGRWWANDFESKWRESHRRQERLHREKQDLKKTQDEQAEKHEKQMAAMRAQLVATPYGKGGRARGGGGKGQGGKHRSTGGNQVCHHFLQQKCSRKNCKLSHPEDESSYSKSDFEVTCQAFPFLKMEYGSWWKKPVEKKDE